MSNNPIYLRTDVYQRQRRVRAILRDNPLESNNHPARWLSYFFELLLTHPICLSTRVYAFSSWCWTFTSLHVLFRVFCVSST